MEAVSHNGEPIATNLAVVRQWQLASGRVFKTGEDFEYPHSLTTDSFDIYIHALTRLKPSNSPVQPLLIRSTIDMSQSQRILIIGAGFGGLWSALSAVLALENAGKRNAAEIVLIAPEPALHIRPRFYETDLSDVTPSIKEVLDTVGVQYIQGIVTHIDTNAHSVTYNGDSSISYTRLILATGSKVVMPTAVSGLEKHAFVVDDYKGALALEKHLKSLSSLPDSPARNTVVVAGGGFTGIEAATELPGRLAQLLGKGVAKVVIIERNKEVGPDLGPGPRPVILEALKELGITSYTGDGVASIDADKVTTESGRCIETKTVIWTAGVRASSLTEQIHGAERDANNRLVVDANLKVLGVADVYATGDTAHALTDGEGHAALMSCQHAVIMGYVYFFIDLLLYHMLI